MKFAQTLSSHVTPEWRTQYIRYDELKSMIYEALDSAPTCDPNSAENDEDRDAYNQHIQKFRDDFFSCADRELTKINTFFAEKLSEALRKYATLKNALKFFQFRDGPISPTSANNADAADTEASFNAERRASTNPSMGASARKRSVFQRTTNEPEEVKSAAKQYKKVHDLKLAFSEFYLSLILLQNYQNLNFQGFRKIMKKHDKLFKVNLGTDYRLKNVDVAPFYVDKEIDRLISDVENLVTNELEGGDRQRAMKRLRVPPLTERTTPWDFFRNGFAFGSFLILLGTVVMSVVFHGLPHSTAWPNVIRMYRGLFFAIVFVFLAGINVNGWANAGVNHVLIFELDPRNHLSHHNLLEIAGLLANLWCLSFLGFIYSDDIGIPHYYWPLCLLSTIMLLLFCPFNIFYRVARKWLLKEIYRLVTAPFHHVTFADFWLADQVNSLVLVLRDLQFLICFYAVEADWHAEPAIGTCSSNLRTYGIRPIVAAFPAWIRFAQCCRRFYDTKLAVPHLVNAGKYSTSFLVVLFSTLDSIDKELNGARPISERPLFYLWVLSALVSSCYSYAWDVKMDWGFFEWKASPSAPLLREDMVYSSRSFYYFAIIEDFLLRYAWVVSISTDEFDSSFHEFLLVGLGFLELFRRFIWNFFRLENEHLNNCGQFRAVRDISVAPLRKNDLQQIEDMMDKADGVFHRRVDYPPKPAESLRTTSTSLRPTGSPDRSAPTRRVLRNSAPARSPDALHQSGPREAPSSRAPLNASTPSPSAGASTSETGTVVVDVVDLSTPLMPASGPSIGQSLAHSADKAPKE